jgi:hypothetical protein
MDNSIVLEEACALLEQGNSDLASWVIKTKYPFSPIKKSSRQYTPQQMIAIFSRDGFIDRYKGTRLIFPPALRLISHYLPQEFPYHKNGKMTEGHIAYWELFPTIDHIYPIARGGMDAPENWITCSMLTNSIKSNWTLEQLGWSVLPPADIHEWDGMLGWFINTTTTKNKQLLSVPYFKKWHSAAVEFQSSNDDRGSTESS